MSHPASVVTRKISSVTGRLWLMGIVLSFFLLSLFTLLWIGRGGAIRPELKLELLGKLAGLYLPLIALMAAFYFGKTRVNRGGRPATVPFETFIFAVLIVTLWVMTPLFFLFFIEAAQDISSTLNRVRPYGDSLALAAVGYYFSKD